MFTGLLGKSNVKRTAERLHASAVGQSREPALYTTLGAPDSVEGRFEQLTLHLILLIERLKGEPGEPAAVRQILFDTYVNYLDGAIREMGVGDLAVGKRMRKLGEAFYGRARAYDAAFAALPDKAPLADVLARTVYQDTPASPAPLADYVVACRAELLAVEVADILAKGPNWSAP